MELTKPLQHYYRNEFAHCYGCGYKNEQGLNIQSYWNGDGAVCRYRPELKYSGGKKDIVYGGLIAAIVDCHSGATAAGAQAAELGLDPEKDNFPRFVTGRLAVDYIAPVPLGEELEIRSRIKEIKGRKVTVLSSLFCGDSLCAKAEAIMIQIRDQ